MLLITRVAEYKQELFRIDPYTFGVEWNGEPGESHVYWRTGDFHRTLMEIGVVHRTGRLHSIELVDVTEINTWLETDVNIRNMSIPKQHGIPICDLSLWPSVWSSKDYVLDEVGTLRVRVGRDFVSIEFSERGHVVSAILAERVSFGCDQQGHLCLIDIENISEHEMALILSGLNKSKTS